MGKRCYVGKFFKEDYIYKTQDAMAEQDIPKYFKPLFEYFEERRKLNLRKEEITNEDYESSLRILDGRLKIHQEENNHVWKIKRGFHYIGEKNESE